MLERSLEILATVNASSPGFLNNDKNLLCSVGSTSIREQFYNKMY